MTDFDEFQKLPKDMNPGMEYCWVLDETKMQAKFAGMQYEHVKAADPDGQKFEKSDARIASDGKIRVGDAVLMRCKKEVVEARRKARAERDNPKRAVRTIKDGFHAQAADMGVQSFEEDHA